jgi:hypothetical protein
MSRGFCVFHADNFASKFFTIFYSKLQIKQVTTSNMERGGCENREEIGYSKKYSRKLRKKSHEKLKTKLYTERERTKARLRVSCQSLQLVGLLSTPQEVISLCNFPEDVQMRTTKYMPRRGLTS